MYHKYHTKGIVIYGINDGDSRRVCFFTEDLGFIFAKVQSGRSISSKMRSSTQDFSLGHYSFVRTSYGWKLVGANAIKNYFELLKKSKYKQITLFNVGNLLRRLLQGEESDTTLFEIVFNFFEFLVSSKEQFVFSAECLVLLRILNRLGFLSSEPEIIYAMSNNIFEEKVLLEFVPKRSKITSIINNSLKIT